MCISVNHHLTCEPVLIFTNLNLAPSPIGISLHGQQVPQLILVHLNIGNLEMNPLRSPLAILLIFHSAEHFIKWAWDNASYYQVEWGGGASTAHGVRLSGAGLAVGKDGAVDALQEGLDQGRHSLLINLFLHGAR